MKIYIATRFDQQLDGRAIRAELEAMGHEVTSTWLDEPADKDPLQAAEDDLRDLDRADAILVVHQSSGGRGMWIEMGYAIAKGQIIILLGWNPQKDRGSVFYHLPEVTHIAHLSQLEFQNERQR